MVWGLKGQRSRSQGKKVHFSLVCPEHNSKTNDPKVFKLGIENDLGICVFVYYLVALWLSVPVQSIAWKDLSRNDLLCVERDVKLYSLLFTRRHSAHLWLVWIFCC